MNNNIESNTKGESSPTRTRGAASSSRTSDDRIEDTLMEALFHNTRRRFQRTRTEDASTPCLGEASPETLLASLGSHHPDDTAQPSSGLRLNASSRREMDNQAVMRALQTGLSLSPVVPEQSYSRSDASREEIMVDILAEAIEINASHNLGIVVNGATTDRRQPGPPERENQYDQQ